MWGRIPDALSGAMANQMYVANFDTEEEMMAFYKDMAATSRGIKEISSHGGVVLPWLLKFMQIWYSLMKLRNLCSGIAYFWVCSE